MRASSSIATGYYDLPNYLGIPGEDLNKVNHYYHEPHPFYGLDVLVIGGKNSAAIAALDLWRHGARVTLVHRGSEMHRHVKYWILPDINNRIKNGEIKAYFDSNVTSITEDDVTLATPQGPITIANQFVFALTGYHPDFAFIEALASRWTRQTTAVRCAIRQRSKATSRASILLAWSSRVSAPMKSSSKMDASTAN